MEFIFTLDFKVRDYECDLQGIVNNSVYQNYFEHTRHEFLLNQGVSFAGLASEGINLVVTRAELLYKQPLKSGDQFVVGLRHLPLSKIRGQFIQHLFLKGTEKPLVIGTFEYAGINPQQKPIKLDQLFNKLTLNAISNQC